MDCFDLICLVLSFGRKVGGLLVVVYRFLMNVGKEKGIGGIKMYIVFRVGGWYLFLKER